VLQQALLLHQQGQLSEAATLYRRILEQQPVHADALHLLGVIALQKRNPAEAVELIGSAIKVNPCNAAFFSNLGVALQDLKRFEEALESFDRALAIRPGTSDVLNNRGSVLRELDRLEDALASYDQALALNPVYAEALNNRANVLRDMGRLEDALASYDRAVATAPHYADAYANRGAVLQLLKRDREAIASYEVATRLSPNQASAQNQLGNILAGQRRFDEAIVRYEHALAANPNYVEAQLNLAKVLKHQNRIEAAVSHYRRASELAPNYVEAYLDLADTLLEHGQQDEALEAAEAAEQLQQGRNFSHFALGVLFARCQRLDAARRHLRQYLQEDCDDHSGAQLILAAIEGGPLPGRASRAHLQDLYAARADRWGRADTVYYGHELAANAIRQFSAAVACLDILDAGCGTGLIGPLVRDIARRLDGVDLSGPMLESAKRKGVYDALCEADLVEFLQSHSARYDVVVSAATLIHFGDLSPVMQAAANSLRSNGLFVFTVLPNEDGSDFTVAPLGGLAEGGCYLHSRDYLKRLAVETGFSVALLETDVHEYDNKGAPVAGLIVALRREEAN
jgi:tetratricopeptide (TPR) repeat protein